MLKVYLGIYYTHCLPLALCFVAPICLCSNRWPYFALSGCKDIEGMLKAYIGMHFIQCLPVALSFIAHICLHSLYFICCRPSSMSLSLPESRISLPPFWLAPFILSHVIHQGRELRSIWLPYNRRIIKRGMDHFSCFLTRVLGPYHLKKTLIHVGPVYLDFPLVITWKASS